MNDLSKIFNDFLKDVEKQMQNEAKRIGKEISEKLAIKYISLIDSFYADLNPSGYSRTGNLYGSYSYYSNADLRRQIYYYGIYINPSKMHDYKIDSQRRKEISAEILLYHFIYRDDGTTYHGGDFHKGLGKQASFSIESEIRKYAQELARSYGGGTNG